MVTVVEAIHIQVRRLRQPVITWFEIDRIIRRLYRERQFDGQSLPVRTSTPSLPTMARIKSALVTAEGLHTKRNAPLSVPSEHVRARLEEQAAVARIYLLAEDPDFPATVCRVTGIADAAADEVCCIVDPWCYISHLSAMQAWGLTNRNPIALHITRPSKKVWRALARKEVQQEYTELYPGQRAPKARERVTFPPMVRQRPTSVFETTYPGRYVQEPDNRVRVSAIGQTFRDMLQEPELCGGMPHVIEVWEKHADTYLDEIIAAMNDPVLHNTKIALVRAGYILTDRLGISDNRIEEWQTKVERGGSRKLDPEQPYASAYSERWGISINV